LTTKSERYDSPRIEITSVRLGDCKWGDEVRVFFRVGERKSKVDVSLVGFTESALKGAIAEKLASMFGLERARSLVGMSYGFDEVMRDGRRFNESKKGTWFDL
jgi:hypothetical protein